MFRIRNQAIIRRLVKRELKSKKQRNTFLIIAIILTTFMMTSIFSIGVSYIESLQKQELQVNGMDYNGLLTGPSNEQISIARKHPEIKYVGMQISCATVFRYDTDITVKFVLRWKDEVNWNRQTIPALYKYKGTYPQKENEIMMSTWALNEAQIKDYKIGMEIPLSYRDRHGTKTKTFILSGYYQDFSEMLTQGIGGSSFVSKAFMETTGYKQEDPNAGRMYLKFHSNFMQKKETNAIKKDLHVHSEQVFSASSHAFDTLLTTGFGVVGLVLLIMLCGYLVIYNVLYISIASDTRMFGLYKAIGMSRKQIQRLILEQIVILSFIAIPIGLLIGGIASNALVPRILHSLGGELIINPSVSFQPFIFLGTAAFTLATAILGSIKPAKTAATMSAIGALHYNEACGSIHRWKHQKRTNIYTIALRNILRMKKRTFIAVISLFIGLTACICINVLIEGRNPDDYLKSYVKKDITLYNQTLSADTDPTNVLDDELFENIQKIDTVRSVNRLSVNPLTFVYDENIYGLYTKMFFKRNMRTSYKEGLKMFEEDPTSHYGFLLGIGKEEFKQMNRRSNTPVDEEAFYRGEIAILMNESEQLQKGYEKFINQDIYFMDLKGNQASIKIAAMMNDIPTTYGIGIAPSFYVYNDALSAFRITPMYESITIDFKKEFDPKANMQIKKLVEDNSAIEVVSKLDIKERLSANSEQLRIFGNSLVAILAFIGVLNFMNMTITSVYERRKEFAMLESIGMQKQQVKKMLVFEGVFHAVIAVFLTLSLGVGISAWIFYSLSKEVYMKFMLPIPMMCSIFGILFLIAIVTPLYVYKISSKKTIVERLRGQ